MTPSTPIMTRRSRKGITNEARGGRPSEWSAKVKVAAVARLEAGESLRSVAEDVGCKPNVLKRWRDKLVAVRPDLFPNLLSKLQAPQGMAEAQVAGDIADRLKVKMDDVSEKLLARIDELVPKTTNIKDLTIAFGIIRDKKAVASGKPTGITANTYALPDDATPAQLEATAEELRKRRLETAAEEKEKVAL